MKSFTTVSEAFQWFLDNIYKNLPPDQKKGKLTYAWRDFTHNKAISERRMKEILSEFGEVEVKTLVTFKPK